jgi:pyruvate formate-lyase activating enzyme-like uncharacterized protein
MAYPLSKLNLNTPFHYCSASFKDGIQLRNRITRRAKNIAGLYEIITEDGTLLKGIILAKKEYLNEIKIRFGIGNDMIKWNKEKNRIETSPYILEEIVSELQFECFLVEEYPTADRLEVERTPLK